MMDVDIEKPSVYVYLPPNFYVGATFLAEPLTPQDIWNVTVLLMLLALSLFALYIKTEVNS
jgi:hypothetical protein